MDELVKRAIQNIDNEMSNFGYSQHYGVAPLEAINAVNAQNISAMSPSVSINPALNRKTYGSSTFMVTITAARTGTGSGQTFNPIFLFGGESFTNAAHPYAQAYVGTPTLTASLVFTGGKNAIAFKYDAGGGNFTTYTVSLGTAGEYPFILNSLFGRNKMRVNAIQMGISDSTKQNQLTASFQTFHYNEFGKAETNDLTTPPDLYQQSTAGIFIPHTFDISGKEGVSLNVLDVDGFSVSLYVYASPLAKLHVGK